MNWSEIDKKMIDYIRDRPELCKDGNSMRQAKYKDSFNEMSLHLNVPVPALKKKWRNIRRNYLRRVNKEIPCYSSDKYLDGSLSFFEPVYGKITVDEEEPECCTVPECPNDKSDGALSESERTIMSNTDQEDSDNDMQLESDETQSVEDFAEAQEEMENETHDTFTGLDMSTTDFFRSLSHHVTNTFSENKQKELLAEIWSTIVNAEQEMLKKQ